MVMAYGHLQMGSYLRVNLNVANTMAKDNIDWQMGAHLMVGINQVKNMVQVQKSTLNVVLHIVEISKMIKDMDLVFQQIVKMKLFIKDSGYKENLTLGLKSAGMERLNQDLWSLKMECLYNQN